MLAWHHAGLFSCWHVDLRKSLHTDASVAIAPSSGYWTPAPNAGFLIFGMLAFQHAGMALLSIWRLRLQRKGEGTYVLTNGPREGG